MGDLWKRCNPKKTYTSPVTGEKLVVVAITSASTLFVLALFSLCFVFCFLFGLVIHTSFLFPSSHYLLKEGCCGIMYAMYTHRKDFNVGSSGHSAQEKVTVSLFVLLAPVLLLLIKCCLLHSLVFGYVLFLFDCFFLC